MFKTLNHYIKLSLMSICVISTLVITTACSSLDSTPTIDDTTASTEKSKESSSYSLDMQSNSQGRPLWIWIAPRYRADMPEGTGEYLIETI